MTRVEELISHAERCRSLAEMFIDPTVAEKLRQLARDYSDLAAQFSEPHRHSALSKGAVREPDPKQSNGPAAQTSPGMAVPENLES
jgi:hypothetical protein